MRTCCVLLKTHISIIGVTRQFCYLRNDVITNNLSCSGQSSANIDVSHHFSANVCKKSTNVCKNVVSCKSAQSSLVVGKVLNVNGLVGKLNRGILDYEMSDSDFCVFLETNTDEPEPYLNKSILCDYTPFVKIKPVKPSSNYLL